MFTTDSTGSSPKRSPVTKTRGSTQRIKFYIFACVCSVGALAIFFRQFFFSRFNLIAGDIGDNRLLIAILEHWFAVVRGQAYFTSPNFFWPVQDVLGYSDPLFLFSFPYILGRAAGLDIYLSFELTLIALKAIGFFSMLWLLHSFVKVSGPVALVGSALFALSNLYYVHMGHAQLMAVNFVPLLVGLACAAWNASGLKQTGLASIYGSGFGLLLAAVLFTSFYIGWFTILAASIFIAIALLVSVFEARTISVVGIWIREVRNRVLVFATAGFAFCISMVPFFVTFLPTLRRTGGRSFQDNLAYSAHPIELINIGQLNLLWGTLFNTIMMRISHRPMVLSETEMGWPLLTLTIMAAGIVLSLRWLSRPTGRTLAGYDRGFLTAVLTCSFVLGWLLSIKVGEQSLWWFIFTFVPGGSAIRVPARFNIVLNIFLVVVVCLVFNWLKERGSSGKIAFWSLSTLIIVEQINMVPEHQIQRDSENAILLRTKRPPSSCRSFFLTSPATRERPFFANQIDAMLIARRDNLPTLNGYSGWVPADWNLDNFEPEYLRNVKFWVNANHITAGLCGFNLRDGSWSPIDFASTIPYLPGSAIDFRRGGNSYDYEAEGWGDSEPGGTWTLGEHSELLLALPKVPATDLLLTFAAHAFLSPQRNHFQETLRVNGRDVADWSVAQAQFEKRVQLPLAYISSRLLKIEFVNHDPRSPSELGLSTDNRKIGLALEALKLLRVGPPSQYLLGSDIDFTWGGNAYLYEKAGWGGAEDGGSWTLGDHSLLDIKLQRPSGNDLYLTIRGHAFVCPQRPRFQETLRVNDHSLATWAITQDQFEKRIRLPKTIADSGLVQIEFVNHDSRSPAELGVSTDSRKLGLAIETMSVGSASGS